MPNPICVLALWEVKDQERAIPPQCSNHQHIKVAEAMEMTGRGDPDASGRLYFRPIARWVGPKQIVMLTAFEWRVVRTEDGYVQRCLVEQ